MNELFCYKPVLEKRVLNGSERYSIVEWHVRKKAVEGFKNQLLNFYITPTKRLLDWDDGLFMAVALTCVLVDTLAQYEKGSPHSNKKEFLEWLRTHISGCANPLPVPIRIPKGEIGDYAEAVYFAYRCGLLHEAHPHMYCGIAGQYRAIKEQETIFTFHAHGLTRYGDGTDCPTVVIDPTRFLRAVLERFNTYFAILVSDSPTHEEMHLRSKFDQKFFWSHGIRIGEAEK